MAILESTPPLPGSREAAEFPFRMKDLCELTGLPRQVIHFYIQQGLVPEGRKTGRNMAYYGDAHVARIRLIRQLQHERFLPLKAIKAMLDEQAETFSPAQRRLLAEVKGRLAGVARPAETRVATVDALETIAKVGLDRQDFDEIVEIGILATSEDESGRLLIAKDAAWILSLWGELKALGFTRDLGFSPADLGVFEEAISQLFKREAAFLAGRLSHLGPERLAIMVERSLPLINTFLTRYHETKVRNFFSAMESPQSSTP